MSGKKKNVLKQSNIAFNTEGMNISRDAFDYLARHVFMHIFKTIPSEVSFRNYVKQPERETCNITSKEKFISKLVPADLFLEELHKRYGAKSVANLSYISHNMELIGSHSEMLESERRIEFGVFIFDDFVLEFAFDDVSFNPEKDMVCYTDNLSKYSSESDSQYRKRVLSQVDSFFNETPKLPVNERKYLNCVYGCRIYYKGPQMTESVFEQVQVIMNLMAELPFLIQDVIEPPKSSTVHLLTSGPSGLNLTQSKMEAPDLDVDVQYNDDFKEIHDIIIENLNKTNTKGLYMLHGKPGTGKTTYIKHLMYLFGKDKKIIYLPPNMTSSLSSPDFLSFLMSQENSVLVIEDAEDILKDRLEGGSQAVSNLLNLSDGILGSTLNIQIIATFNSEISKIDTALLRRGRLTAKYEFKELNEEKAKALAKKIGNDPENITGPTILTDIYNMDDREFKSERKKVGFAIEAPKAEKKTTAKKTVSTTTTKVAKPVVKATAKKAVKK